MEYFIPLLLIYTEMIITCPLPHPNGIFHSSTSDLNRNAYYPPPQPNLFHPLIPIGIFHLPAFTRSSQLEYFIFQLPPCATSADIMHLGHSVLVQSWSLSLGPVLVTQSRSSLGLSVSVQSWSLSLGPVLVTQSQSSLGHSVSVQSWSLSLGPVLVTQSRSSLGHSVSVQSWSLSLGPVLVTQSRSSLGHSVSVQSWSLSLSPVLVTQSRSRQIEQPTGHMTRTQAPNYTNTHLHAACTGAQPSPVYRVMASDARQSHTNIFGGNS